MDNPKVCLMAWFRNDAPARNKLFARIGHLIDKDYPNIRYMFIVGDSQDDTYDLVRTANTRDKDVSVLKFESGITGKPHFEKMQRLSATLNFALDNVRQDDEYCLLHESDLWSPKNIVQRLLETGKCPVAAWPTIELYGRKLLYDTYALIQGNHHFEAFPPYHKVYSKSGFEVDSAGSVVLFHAEDALKGIRCKDFAMLSLCRELKKAGRSIWCFPEIEVVQPLNHWDSTPTDDGPTPVPKEWKIQPWKRLPAVAEWPPL